MKIVVFGASGKTGLQVVEQALSLGTEVTAFVRRENSIILNHQSLKVVVGQLDDIELIKTAIKDADACASTLGGGSLTHHSPEIVKGITNVISAMESVGVNRLIYLSSLGAGESRYYMSPIPRFLIADLLLRVPLADHNKNEMQIKSSKLNWTIVRPGSLFDGPATGNVHHGAESTSLKDNKPISRADVASFMVEQLNSTSYINKASWIKV